MLEVQQNTLHPSRSICLDCYGVICDIVDNTENAGLQVIEGIRHDFNYFISSNRTQAPVVRLVLTDSSSRFPGRRTTWPDGTIIYDSSMREIRLAHVHCQDESTDYVINYLHSVIGEILEKRGWFRMHACGHTLNGQVEIWTAHSGAGKSSRTLSVLNFSNEKIFGDEILWFHDGFVYPFSIPIATQTELATSTRRRTFLNSRKSLTAIPIDRVSQPSSDFIVRCIGKPDRIRFLLQFTLGLGLPQMYVYLVRPNNFIWLSNQAFARLRFAFSLWSRLKPADLSELRSEL